MDKLSLGHNNPQEEQIQVTNTLIPAPTTGQEEKATTEEKMDVEARYQQEKKIQTTTEDLCGPA